MSSSTSSSRKIYFRTLLVILLGMAAAAGLFRLFTIGMGASAEGIMGRVVESRQALPKIVAEPEDLVMVFGSSMVQAGFSPRQFDKQLIEQGKQIKSFNFGFGGLNPFYQDFLSRRIKEAFEAENRKLKLSVIEFNPFQATKTRWDRAQFTVDSYLTMLASDQELWEITKQDLTRGLLLYNIKYLRGDISAEMVTSFFGQEIFPTTRPQRLQEPQEMVDKRRELGPALDKAFEEDYPDFKGEDWHYGWQGGGTIPEERSAETLALFEEYYATFQTPEFKQNARNRRIMTADIEQLNFSPEMIQSFINIVENFKQISEQVEVIVLPRSHTLIQYNEEAQARYDQALTEIEQATGISIRDHQLIEQIEPHMYSDATHFTRYEGAVVYTSFLVEEFADLL